MARVKNVLFCCLVILMVAGATAGCRTAGLELKVKESAIGKEIPTAVLPNVL